jgi:exosome complex exonuclease DIS3/RRP44
VLEIVVKGDIAMAAAQNSLTEIPNRVFSKKTRRGTVALIVREHYLRNDIQCGIPRCPKCTSTTTSPITLSLEANHYLIPDANFVNNYWELLESPHLNHVNVIILKTVANEVAL